MSDPNPPGELPPDVSPEYAEAYRRAYERALRGDVDADYADAADGEVQPVAAPGEPEQTQRLENDQPDERARVARPLHPDLERPFTPSHRRLVPIAPRRSAS